MADNASQGRAQKVVCFDCSKRESFTPSSGLKTWRRKLQTSCVAPRRSERQQRTDLALPHGPGSALGRPVTRLGRAGYTYICVH